MELGLRVQDPSGSTSRDVIVDVQDGALTRDLIEALLRLLEWPRQTCGGQPLQYALCGDGGSAALDPHAPLASLNLRHGSLLILGPVLPSSR